MADTLEIAGRPAGDGMPLGHELTPMIQASQVEIPAEVAEGAEFDDNAALTVAWEDYQRAQAWLDTNAWLAEWQYIDYLYQSPNFDRDWRAQAGRATRISRFNVAKNSNTMATQIRRGIFAETTPFILEPRGKLAANPDAQKILDAWTEIFSVLSDRTDFEYQMSLLIDCMCLQGTGIADFGWEEKQVIHISRVPKVQPVETTMADGTKKKVHTLESDDWQTVEEIAQESWPIFEYRRLGTTLYDEKWRTPNRPELSAGYKINVDYVTMDDLRQMRELECYKNIPEDADLKTFFLGNPDGDAQAPSNTAQTLNTQSAVILHAAGEERDSSADPFLKPMMKVARWTPEDVTEFLVYESRKLVIRNEKHPLGDFSLGATATWWNIDNSGYGIGIGRLNAGDQRMDQGVLNEVLKMIAFPMNAPLIYNTASGNAPTQQVVTALGTMWGLNAPSGDIRKELMWMQPPTIPVEAWKIYELGKQGGEDLVGASAAIMQGQLGGPGSSAARTATGINRLGSKADENMSGQISHIEGIIQRWIQFLWKMVIERMPIAEMRKILSEKFGADILSEIDAEEFLSAKFEIKILCGQKLAAKASITQMIPFLLQLVQQPQLMEQMHQKGWTVNFKAIEELFMQMSELQGREDIIVKLTPEEMQQVQQANPGMQQAQAKAAIEKLKGQNKLQEIQAQGTQDIQQTVVDHALQHVSGDVPLDLAEARLSRNTDMNELQNGIPGVGE